MRAEDFLIPDWPAPASVRAMVTTRHGGVSAPPWNTLNLGDHVGDSAKAVSENRRRLVRHLPGEPLWLRQVHGVTVVETESACGVPEADAAVARTPDRVCAVMTADCLPVLFCDRSARVVAAAHAGWRGLCAGVLEATVAAMQVPPGEVMAWLGPAIGPTAFEVGDEVRTAFLHHGPAAATAFVPGTDGRWLADLYRLARLRLGTAGVTAVFGGEFCTMSDPLRWFSYRRDGVTGRMAALIWRTV